MSDTLASMITRVDGIINREDVTSAMITGWINDAQRLICRSHNMDIMKCRYQTTTTDKTQSYALPDGSNASYFRYKREIACHLINASKYRVRLTRKPTRDIEDMEDHIEYPDSTKNTGYGTPSEYSCDNGYLYLYETPDHASNDSTAWTIDLLYYGYFADLSAGTDYNKLVQQYPEILEKVAASIGFENHTQEFDKAQYYLTQAKSLLIDVFNAEREEEFGTREEGFEPDRSTGTYPRD